MNKNEAKERLDQIKDSLKFSLVFYYLILAFITTDFNPFDWGLYTRISYAAAVLITTALLIKQED